MLSYWEKESFFKTIDCAIIGSGIVGLSAAIAHKEKFPNETVFVFESGFLPSGASTKNAGFACFGSPTELLSDLKNMTKEEVFLTLEKRWKGLQNLIQLLGRKTIDFQQNGGYELFRASDNSTFEACSDQLNYLNQLVLPIFKKPIYTIEDQKIPLFGFSNISHIIQNELEGQIDTGKMMQSLLLLAKEKGIQLINGITISDFQDNEYEVILNSKSTDFKTKKLIIATNGFAKKLLPELDVSPARAQVLITKPIKNLQLKGTFHYEEGFYYFRNINNRILLGGGRNLDIKGETTTHLDTTPLIQNQLEHLLKEVILPQQSFEIDYRWSGIMGVGAKKTTLVKQLSTHVFCGVRMGGMGVAIGSLIGTEVVDLMD